MIAVLEGAVSRNLQCAVRCGNTPWETVSATDTIRTKVPAEGPARWDLRCSNPQNGSILLDTSLYFTASFPHNNRYTLLPDTLHLGPGDRDSLHLKIDNLFEPVSLLHLALFDISIDSARLNGPEGQIFTAAGADSSVANCLFAPNNPPDLSGECLTLFVSADTSVADSSQSVVSSLSSSLVLDHNRVPVRIEETSAPVVIREIQ
ncbi:MAG: hypothetical protein ACQEQV_02320 [Fibrobacterota bacterium]